MKIKCPDCGCTVSSDAPLCPHCGCSGERIRRKAKLVGCIVRPIQILIIGALLVATCKGGLKDNKKHTDASSDANIETTTTNTQSEDENMADFASTSTEPTTDVEEQESITQNEIDTDEKQATSSSQQPAEQQVSSKDTTPSISVDRLLELTQ